MCELAFFKKKYITSFVTMSDVENTCQISLEGVDETQATGNTVSGNTDSLSVQELMSNFYCIKTYLHNPNKCLRDLPFGQGHRQCVSPFFFY